MMGEPFYLLRNAIPMESFNRLNSARVERPTMLLQ